MTLLARSSDMDNLEELQASTKRIVVGKYLVSRNKDDKIDKTVNVWTNIVERQEIGKLVNLLSVTNKLYGEVTSFRAPITSMIYLGTNDVPLRVVEIYAVQGSRSYSLQGTFIDGRLKGTFSSSIENFTNYKYCQEVFRIARMTDDGEFVINMEQDRLNAQFHENYTLEERLYLNSVEEKNRKDRPRDRNQ